MAGRGGLYRLSGEPVTPTEMVRKTRDQPAASEAPLIACHPAHREALLKMFPASPAGKSFGARPLRQSAHGAHVVTGAPEP